MELKTLKVRTRESIGKGPAGRLRATGSVPGVLYGGDRDPVSIQVDARTFEHVLHSRAGEHAVLQLDVEDSPELSTPALLKLVQHHPVRGEAIHADFLRIRLDQRIVTRVPVRADGQAEGVRDGGVLDHVLREIEVECLALEVPEEILVDAQPLKMGESIHARQLTLPDNVTLITDPDLTVVAVHAPRVVVEAAAAEPVEEGAEPTGPEVIGEKKREEEEEE